ncbi:MAG TPA: hypothetical protein VGD10_04905 [Allosphingosinicella sp.]|uniref:hypothetical protein n=1 Tax=Allosphingosinicella sp. TaxID=2823234 RepID=UPI002EDA256C
MKGFLGVLAGFVSAVLAAMLVSFLGGLIVGVPTGVDMSNADTIRESYASLGVGPQLLGIVAWGIGALVGAYVAKRIAGRSWAAWTVAVLITLYQLLSVALLPMPLYMRILALVLPIVGGFIANRLVAERATDAHRAETAADADL